MIDEREFMTLSIICHSENIFTYQMQFGSAVAVELYNCNMILEREVVVVVLVADQTIYFEFFAR